MSILSVAHIGLTVTDIKKSIGFYRDVLGLKFVGEMLMEGPETERLFGIKDCKAKVAYLNGSDHVMAPPVELIEFVNVKIEKEEPSLVRTSISELCFFVDDIDAEYERLKNLDVEFLSSPQTFDSTKYGFGKSRAVYLKDPDGIILELIQEVK